MTTNSEGFVFATTGELYTTVARRAARTLKRAMPTARIDLFTDQDISDPVFEQIHQLGDGFFRPKMQALRESRFERTVYLDSDVIVLVDVSELFRVLDRYDMAGANGVARGAGMMTSLDEVPRCAPLINSGVLAVRRNEATRSFLFDWEQAMRDSGAPFDQPILREMLYRSDIRFCGIGMEYNLKGLSQLDIWKGLHGAPRILHVSSLNTGPPGDPETPFRLKGSVGKRRAEQVRRLLKNDRSLGGRGDIEIVPIIDELKGKRCALL